jgi:RimJ/RimL family protein N-acetyltransferase
LDHPRCPGARTPAPYRAGDDQSSQRPERGRSRVEWTTDESNEQAKAFYAAFGAKPLPSKIFYRAEGDVFSS